MEVKNVFGTYVVKARCENSEWYKNKVAVENLDRLFRQYNKSAAEAVGDIKTTINCPIPVPMIPGLESLVSWVEQQIMLAAPYFVDFSPSGFKFDLQRTWANKMFKGSSVLPHTHDVIPGTTNRHTTNSRGVAIFYQQLPTDSSDLVFIQNDEKIYGEVKEGDLVFHSKNILHAVTEHQSDIPRICLVFEFVYLENV